MEDSKSGSESDKDKKMKGRFGLESSSSKKEAEEKRDDQEERRVRIPSLFERITQGDEADEDEDKPRDVTESLFHDDAPEVEDDESKPDTAEVPPEPEAGAEVIDEMSEDLSDDETQQAIEQYVEIHKPEVETEEEAQLLENIEEAGSVEEGYQATLDQLDLDEADLGEGDEEDEPDEAEADVDTDEDEEDDPAASTLSTSTTTTPPPTPPTPTPQPAPLIPPIPTPPTPNYYGAGPLHNANAQPQPAAHPNTLHNQPNTSGNRYQRGADMLVGGLVGYFIGRRRGRINTEAELLPIQKKLEKEVTKLYDDIAEKETKIRKLVALKAETAEPETVLSRKLEDEDQQEAMTRRSFESANRTDFQKASPERLGRVVVPPLELAVEKGRDTETMSLHELLEVAANIKQDNITVRQMYETGRLDAIGLRRVVHEYLRGDHYERVLAEHLKKVETHESDPREPHEEGTYGSGGFGEVEGAQEMQNPSSSQYTYHFEPTPQQQPLNVYQQMDPENRQAAMIGIVVGLVLAVFILIAIFILV